MGLVSHCLASIAGYWRAWEVWAYEVLHLYPPESTYPNPSVLPRSLKWSDEHAKKKVLRGNLHSFRSYLDALTPFQVEWDPWRVRGGAEPAFLTESRRISASRVFLESYFGWRWYLGERVIRQSLRAPHFISPGPLPPRASSIDQYTADELARFIVPDFE